METIMLRDLSASLQSLFEASRTRVVCVGAGRATPRSGLLIANGELVTVARAAEHGEQVPVHVGESELSATVVGFDPASGITLLSHPDFAADSIADGGLPALGSLSITVACPIPDDHEVRLGMIRCVGGSTRLAGGRQIASYFQTDSGRFRGFAGSVVFGPDGNVLGMTMPAHRREESFVIPVGELLKITDQLRNGEALGTGYLGIQATAVDLPKAQDGISRGLLVTGVESDSPAEKAGLAVGNFVVRVGERETPDLESLFDALVGVHAGTELPVSVITSPERIDVIAVQVALRK